YFMMGLPTETDEDIVGITQLAQKVVDLFYSLPNRPRGKGVQVSISTATFVPKPFTPFEFEPQATREEIMHKQELLMQSIPSKKIRASWHDPSTSILEAVLARADRKVGAAIYSAWKKGCKFDSWSEHFHFEKWEEAFAENGLDMAFYASRRREHEEIMPWEHIDYFVSKEFLVREHEKAKLAQTTEHCRNKCSACGVNKAIGGACFG
ncbi:MAG: B12-binding domain-containing radical SAM protein, partial [Oscillospiraceae bacterium]|nr:B12-binding domain-containing radical SAM protein [Oscillospiraceae bacterium]